jgi:glucosyl-3-phosphoglycerate phosphatase
VSTREFVPQVATLRRLVLWRHGQTSWNLEGRAQGHADIELDETGRAQAKRAARDLAAYEPAYIWSSDLARAWQTAGELAVVVERDVLLDARLREFDVGIRQGLTFAEFESAHPWLSARLHAGERLATPGQETHEAVAQRMMAALTEAAAALSEGETGVIVGHGASLRTGLLTFFGATSAQHEMLAGMANCAWAVIEERARRGWQIMDYNAQTLPPPIELSDAPSGT